MTDTTQPGGWLGTLARALLGLLNSGVQQPQAQQSAGPAKAPVAPRTIIHQEAEDLIIAAEVTDRQTYEQRYARPTWPEGDSGVTIGLGFDLGYETAAGLDRDWPMLPVDVRARLKAVTGMKGAAAKAALPKVAGITIPWDAAVESFRTATLPRYVDQTAAAFPGAAALPPRCHGALVSLVYNRGTAMADAKGDTMERRREMRQIRDDLARGDIWSVPSRMRAMKRLWPTMAGLRQRREDEACLWERGLLAHLVAGGGQLHQGDRGPEVAALQRALGVTPDGVFGPQTRAAVERFQANFMLPVTGVVGKDTAAALGA